MNAKIMIDELYPFYILDEKHGEHTVDIDHEELLVLLDEQKKFFEFQRKLQNLLGEQND